MYNHDVRKLHEERALVHGEAIWADCGVCKRWRTRRKSGENGVRVSSVISELEVQCKQLVLDFAQGHMHPHTAVQAISVVSAALLGQRDIIYEPVIGFRASTKEWGIEASSCVYA